MTDGKRYLNPSDLVQQIMDDKDLYKIYPLSIDKTVSDIKLLDPENTELVDE
jgi:hypothetical protein